MIFSNIACELLKENTITSSLMWDAKTARAIKCKTKQQLDLMTFALTADTNHQVSIGM